MSDIAIRMEHVYKKFRKGEVFNSLRDLLPALTGRMFREGELSEADKREFWALQDLSFEVKQGESLGIIGQNGAGKSTALKILSRIMKPTKGRMVVHGRLSALIEVWAGFHQDLTGRENIFLQGTILGMAKREIQSKLDQIIAFSGLEEFIDTPVKHYSTGMCARLGFSVAAHVDPDVLIVDEVLSVGDFAFQARCVQRMHEVLRSGTAVLFVSHNMNTVAEFCQRCLLLEKGRTLMLGPVAEVISAYLNRSKEAREADASSGPVMISRVTVRNEHGACLRFHAGQKAWIDVDLAALVRCTRLSVALYIKDEQLEDVFGTSTTGLGSPEFSLEPGQRFQCTFELSLNLVGGTYYPTLLVFRCDNQTTYDRWMPAATFHITSADDVRGAAHCFPKVVRHEVLAASRESLPSNPEPETPVASER